MPEERGIPALRTPPSTPGRKDFRYNDLVAIGIVEGLDDRSVRVPRDITFDIVSSTGTSKIAEYETYAG